MSAMQNTLGKEQISQDMDKPASDAALREYCDRNYHQLLPIIAEKVHQEKVQQEKLKAVKAHLNFEEVLQYSESGTPSRMWDLKKRLESRGIRSMSRSLKPRRGRPNSPRKRVPKIKMVFKRKEKGVFHRLGDKGKSMSAHSNDSMHRSASSHKTKALSESKGSSGGHWKSRSKKQRSSIEDDDLSQPWVCEETNPFTSRIRYFDLPKRTRMPSHVKTYDGSEDPEDNLKIFQAATKMERWVMPTWCHIFNSTLTGSARVWFDDLPPESVDSYDDLKEAFLANFCQQKKCIKDPVEIHHIKQREGESTKDFVRRFKVESRDVKGAPEIMRISGFMHGIINPKLIKRCTKKILKSIDEMMRITTSILKGEVAGGNQERRSHFCHGNSRRPDIIRISIKEALKTSKGQSGDRIETNRRIAKEWGTIACNQRIKEKRWEGSAKSKQKGETSSKDKALEILMVQPWQRVSRQRITQSFSPDPEISFPPLEEEEGTEGPMIIEAEIGGHFIHRMNVDGGLASEILYEHCFNRLYSEIKNQMVLATAPLIGFSGEIIWPLGIGPKEQPPTAHQAIEERIKVAINPDYPEQTIMIGSTLTKEGRNKREIVTTGCPLVRQKRRSHASDKNQAIQEEVEKLVDAGIMKEVHYHSWLSNPVMVKKHDDSWRMCVNFKDLNKACPKDSFPLPEIDWKVESLCDFPFKCFLDAYKGYHQIKIAKEDEEKTSFITSQGVFCYSKIPFSLRNARVTYQRLVDKAFHKQIGRNLKVYVDDLVIKSHTEDEIIRDIEETFKTLWEINMKLNLKKCTFGVEEGMFLGYKVNTKGIKVCPEKVDAVLSLQSLKCLKDIQKLNGKLASLNRFLAKSIEKSLLFFKTLKKCTKKSDFHLTEEVEAAFKQMKQLIAELPILTAPEEKEEFIVYLAASKEAVSAVLMTEREAKQLC
ncbi:reverse transcriptase domain-containing protein [Tanacetum coccineum]